MTMATFPTMYRHGAEIHHPIVENFTNTMAVDPAIRSQSEGGYTASRARFKRITRKWTVKYDWVSQANKNTFRAFEDARLGGADSFTWTNPENSTAYTVRFLEPVVYTPQSNANFLWWTIEFTLEQV